MGCCSELFEGGGGYVDVVMDRLPTCVCWLHDAWVLHEVGVWVVDAVEVCTTAGCKSCVEPAIEWLVDM